MPSPSVSSSATSTPSREAPLIRPIAVSVCTLHPWFPSDHRPVTPAAPKGRPSGDRTMSTYKSEFLQILASRGFIHQVSEPEALDAKAAAGAIVAYVGFDATAPSLHIGNLLTIMMLRWLQKTGHRPIALMGGGTSKIGRHFTINRMLTFDSVKLRLDREQPLTFLEFNYMILQAYDFVELHKRH